MNNNHQEIDFKTVLAQSFATGQGVILLSASMTDEQILSLIKSACVWSNGKAFQVVQRIYPVADTSQLEGLTLSEKSDSALIENSMKVL